MLWLWLHSMPVAVLFAVTMDVVVAMAVIVDSSFGRIRGQHWDACGCGGSAGPMQLTRQAVLAAVVAGKEVHSWPYQASALVLGWG